MRRVIPRHGDSRTVTLFLLKPRTLPSFDYPGIEIRRWLERAVIQQVFTKYTNARGGRWFDARWIDAKAP